MRLWLALRVNEPSAWMGRLNCLLYMCRVLRDYSSDISPVVFASPDLDEPSRWLIVAAHGVPPIPMVKQLRETGFGEVHRFHDTVSARQLARDRIDAVLESGSCYGSQRLETLRTNCVKHFFGRPMSVIKQLELADIPTMSETAKLRGET